jgi:hypothetical protein
LRNPEQNLNLDSALKWQNETKKLLANGASFI